MFEPQKFSGMLPWSTVVPDSSWTVTPMTSLGWACRKLTRIQTLPSFWAPLLSHVESLGWSSHGSARAMNPSAAGGGVVTGVALGLTGSFALQHVMKGLLYGVSATDPMTFVVISLLLFGATLLACYVPARRATEVDPIIALRFE